MAAEQLNPENISLVINGIKWLYSLTAARSWLVYKTISLHNKPFIDIADQHEGIEQFLSLWEYLLKHNISEGYRVRLEGTVSEYAPLRPGITPLTMPVNKWDNAISDDVDDTIRKLSQDITNNAEKLKKSHRNYFEGLEPEKLAYRKRMPQHAKEDKENKIKKITEDDLLNYLDSMLRVTSKYKLFMGHENEEIEDEIINQFRDKLGISEDNIPFSKIMQRSKNTQQNAMTSSGIIRCPNNLQDGWVYLGFSAENMEYGIPIMMPRKIYEEKVENVFAKQGRSAGIELVGRLKWIDKGIENSINDIFKINPFDANIPKVILEVKDQSDIRHVSSPHQLKGRLWAFVKGTKNSGKEMGTFVVWSSKLHSDRHIQKSANKMAEFISNYIDLFNLKDLKVISQFDQQQNRFVRSSGWYSRFSRESEKVCGEELITMKNEKMKLEEKIDLVHNVA